MDINNGIISYFEAMKISGSPLDGENVKADTIIKLVNELSKLRLAELVNDSRGIIYLIDPDKVEDSERYTSTHYNRMQLDVSFIPDILRALNNFNIIDNIRTLYRNKLTPSIGVTQNNFVWDAIAYTKTTGINSINASQAKIYRKTNIGCIRYSNTSSL
jgi:hypothetical protein